MLFVCYMLVFFFKQKTAYEMRISDWSSDVCSSDLRTLTDDLGEIGDGVLENLLVAHRLANTHVQGDLGQARHLHRVFVAKTFNQLWRHFFFVNLFKPAHGSRSL